MRTKTPLIWVQTLTALVLLLHFNPPGSQWKLDSHRSKILRKLQTVQVHPDVLHCSSFAESNSVDCVFEGGLGFDFNHFNAGYKQPSSLLYVCSTAVGVAKRHLNRMAVYRGLKKTEFVDAELSLRYWASHHNLFDFVVVPLRSFADYQAAWTFEHELITQWQTPLNYPKAMQFLKKTALGFRVSRKHRMSAYATFGLRLWRKLRKRLHGQCKQFAIKDCRQLAWNLLYDLGSYTMASFKAAQLVRSNKKSDEEVCALIKLSRNLENPVRNKIHSILKSAVKFRGTMHWLSTAKPLEVLPLAQSSFTYEWELWLKSLIGDFKYLFPSFHLPKSNLREVPHQSIKKFLHNLQSWEEQMWNPEFEVRGVACPCNQCQHKLPDHCFVQGLVAAGLEEFECFLLNSSSVALASAASTFFPGRNNLKARSRALFDLWLKRNRLPHTLHAVFETFCDEQWALHAQALQDFDRLT